MDTKTARHARLLELIGETTVTSQQELLDALQASDLGVDQSTLSRDLRELGIRKVAGRYTEVDAGAPAPGFGGGPGVIRYTTCGPHLIVIHTVVGQAQPVGVFLDAAREEAIEGTMAGDDTVFVATRGRRQQEVVLRRLATWFGEERHDR